MKITMDTAEVAECTATACAYNIDCDCHARAITVGNSAHPLCDTFMATGSHCREASAPAGVGACKLSKCSNNLDYECQAERIRLASHEGHVHCMTFTVH